MMHVKKDPDDVIEDAVLCNLLYISTGNEKILEIRNLETNEISSQL